MHGRGFQAPDQLRKLEAEARMTEDACILDKDHRRIAEKTIVDHCRIRGWELHVVNCRTNHVHVVVSANREPHIVREQLMAWCQRRLKDHERSRLGRAATAVRENWWTERGSDRWIGDEESLEAAIFYVRDGQ